MKLSWSHKLFLKINALIGKNPIRDRVMIFGATWMLFALILIMALYTGMHLYEGDRTWVIRYVEFFVTAFIFSEAVSYLFGFIFRRPRPIIEFPQITQLVKTMTTWKSFPSDHTIGSFCLAGALLLVPGSSLWFIILSYFCALFVSISRVYVGVHYPRDIVGGVIIAHVVLFFSPFLFSRIIEPITRLW